MPHWYCSVIRYRGWLFLVLTLLAMKYFFGLVTEIKSFFVLNDTRIPQLKNWSQHSPAYNFHSETKLFLNNSTPLQNITKTPINSIHSPEFSVTENFDNYYLPPCSNMLLNLQGQMEILKSPVPTIQELEERFSWVKRGGHWAPENCKVLETVAIIVPFRDRDEQLLLFLQHMHPFLKRQLLDYTIYIIEQDKNKPFNRAMLMNVGFKEALKIRNYDCFIFHDIDLLPEDDRNLYTCPPGQPRHMSVAVDIFKYRLPYPAIFGGVSAITRKHFELLNGFSNKFWGWGGEDDDMSNRIRHHDLNIVRYSLRISRYTMQFHDKKKANPLRMKMLKQGPKGFGSDGLNSLQYQIIQSKQNLLYTWFLVVLNSSN